MPAKPKFEDELKKLEKLVAEMESGNLSLDEMIKHFEEGRKLADFCNKELTVIRQRIEAVTNPASSSPGTEEIKLDELRG